MSGGLEPRRWLALPTPAPPLDVEGVLAFAAACMVRSSSNVMASERARGKSRCLVSALIRATRFCEAARSLCHCGMPVASRAASAQSYARTAATKAASSDVLASTVFGCKVVAAAEAAGTHRKQREAAVHICCIQSMC